MREYQFPCCELDFWLLLMLCLLLVSLAGLASGLALGLLSFSQVDLEVISKSGLPKDRKHAGYHRNTCHYIMQFLRSSS